jgi:putative nucleotidyltransferase with HDIG domain
MRDIIGKRLQSDSLKLPTLPEVAVRCLELAHDPDVTFSALAQVIERDPFIASRVVRMSNSPLYGGLARITTIDGAVGRMGISTLVALLQELAAEQVFTSRDPIIRNAFRGIWEHCLGVAHLSRDLAALIGHLSPNTAYLAGLFHDIGKPVVAALLLEAERGAGQGAFLHSGVWRRVVDECHRDVGAIIAFRWYLPREVATAVAEIAYYDLKRGRSSASNVVRLANAICQREGLDVQAVSARELDRVVLQGTQVLRLSQEQVDLATTGLVARVQALTTERGEEGSTRVFDRMSASG